MRKYVLGAVVTLAAVAGAAPAQAPEEPAPVVQGAALDVGAPERPDPGRNWVRADYLLWWVKDGPVPVPLATQGGTFAAGRAVGTPGAAVVLGDSSLDYGTFSGVRFGGGRWLGEDRTFAVEANALFLEDRGTGQAVRSDAGGSPTLSRPFVDAQTGQPAAFLISTPGSAAGGLGFLSRNHVLGAELNSRLNVLDDDSLRLSLLGGFRYLEVDESLTVTQQIELIDLPFPTLPRTLADRFYARNPFFGGQLGAEAEYRNGGLFVDVLGKVALGATLEETDVTGNGFLVEPSNGGRHHHSEFAVVPEAEVRAGYQFGPHLRVSVGYDFLLLSNVLRPGDQIDPAINTSQLGGAAPTGPARPVFPAHDTTFWAQGINFGLELRF
jgi:hypothetical protein